jgi:hypothetical protein
MALGFIWTATRYQQFPVSKEILARQDRKLGCRMIPPASFKSASIGTKNQTNTTMNLLTRTTLIVTASIAMLGSAHAGGMQKAIEALEDKATTDKGGHRVAAIKQLKAALEQIEAGVEFDQTHVTKEEGKKKKGK